MSSGNQSAIFNAFNQIFEQNRQLLKQSSHKPNLNKVPNRDIELAVIVILVDLASSDSNFDSREFMTICIGMQRLFGISQSDVTKLISQANQILAGMRGVDKFATLLKETLDEEKREQVLEVIKNVIAADGKVDDMEVYLQHKFQSLLGLDKKAQAPKTAGSEEA